MDNSVIDNHLLNNSETTTDLSIFKWWEKKRILYNISVVISGVFMMLIYAKYVQPFEIILALIWGLITNIAYFSGVIIDLSFRFYLKIKINPSFLFYIGLIFSILFTLLLALGYYESKTSAF